MQVFQFRRAIFAYEAENGAEVHLFLEPRGANTFYVSAYHKTKLIGKPSTHEGPFTNKDAANYALGFITDHLKAGGKFVDDMTIIHNPDPKQP